jgi:hypothetical protein
MKKISTYYFLVLAATNAWLGFIFIRFNRMMLDEFVRYFEGRALPIITVWATSCPWWPFVLAAFFAGGLALSIATRIRSSMLCHLVIAGLVAESFILFWTMAAYAVPWVSVVSQMSE